MAGDRDMGRHQVRRLDVRPMEASDAEVCAHLWLAAYRRVSSVAGEAPTIWLREPSRVRRFIAERASAGYVLTAGADIEGYLVYDRARFHGREAAFCPPLSHGVTPDHTAWGYRLLYRAASSSWVENGVLDHYMSVAAVDRDVLSLFFDLGFGRYVVDAYRGVAAVPRTTGRGAAEPVCAIRRAEPSAFADVRALMDMALEFYLEAPLFLRQPPNTDADMLSLLEQESCAVFLADVGGTAVGVMNVRTDDEVDPLSLADPQTARLDPLGAYIRPEYRNRGIGDALLAECVSWAREHGAALVHVDYEGANIFASSYWVKHFTPVLLSLKRSVHPDILSFSGGLPESGNRTIPTPPAAGRDGARGRCE